MKKPRAIGGHQSPAARTTTWLTPPHVLAALGGAETFDFDPCAAPETRPWPTALRMNSHLDGDGLSIAWEGRVLLNPPYTSAELGAWLKRLADHGRGTALIFARTETAAFAEQVWERASGLLFLTGRLHFHRTLALEPDRCLSVDHDYAVYDGVTKAEACIWCGRAKANAGAPSVLCAYGVDDMDRLAACTLEGAFVPLRFARFVLVASLDLSWSEIVRDWLVRQDGPVSVSDAYRHFARHPKAQRNRHWQPKIRQKLRQVGRRLGRDRYIAAAA
jgi:hypothetical protein